MKTEWICKWQLIPGAKAQTKTFPTQEAARKAMAKVLTDAVDLKGYIDALRKEEGEDCVSSADFLERFLSDLSIPESDTEIPPHLDIPDHCRLEIHPTEGFRWRYKRGEHPSLVVSHVYYGDDGYPYIIDFSYDKPTEIKHDRVNAVYIHIDKHVNYGTSSYPLMVLSVLSEEPQTQDQIVDRILKKWNTVIERKAIGRHLELLKTLGYPVHHSPNGYYCEGEFVDPDPSIKYSPSAYPLLILRVLDGTPKTLTAIIHAVQEKYGAKIDRKAVKRHLDLLEALHFPIEYNKHT